MCRATVYTCTLRDVYIIFDCTLTVPVVPHGRIYEPQLWLRLFIDVRIQSQWRGYVARKQFRVLQDTVPPKNRQRREDFYMRKVRATSVFVCKTLYMYYTPHHYICTVYSLSVRNVLPNSIAFKILRMSSLWRSKISLKWTFSAIVNVGINRTFKEPVNLCFSDRDYSPKNTLLKPICTCLFVVHFSLAACSPHHSNEHSTRNDI